MLTEADRSFDCAVLTCGHCCHARPDDEVAPFDAVVIIIGAKQLGPGGKDRLGSGHGVRGSHTEVTYADKDWVPEQYYSEADGYNPYDICVINLHHPVQRDIADPVALKHGGYLFS